MLGKTILLTLALATTVISVPVNAQNTVAPASHWGGLMYPDLWPTREAGIQFLNFTEFDNKCAEYPMKEHPNLQDCGDGGFKRYNDFDETIGFNIITLSRTRFMGAGEKIWGNMLYRSVISAGVTHDYIPEILQNQVIHSGSTPLSGTQDPIYRDETKDWFPLLGYSGELILNLRPFTVRSDPVNKKQKKKKLYMDPSPLFIGGGFSAGTIQNELFGQLGIKNAHVKLLGGKVAPGFSYMSRLGVIYNFDFDVAEKHLLFPPDRLSSNYLINQASASLTIFLAGLPIVAEYGLTSSTGLFVETEREPATDLQGNPIIGDDDKQVTQNIPKYRRVSHREIFRSYKLAISAVNIEIFNDSEGKKDRGPSFGFRVYLKVNESNSESARSFIDRFFIAYLTLDGGSDAASFKRWPITVVSVPRMPALRLLGSGSSRPVYVEGFSRPAPLAEETAGAGRTHAAR